MRISGYKYFFFKYNIGCGDLNKKKKTRYKLNVNIYNDKKKTYYSYNKTKNQISTL